MRLRLTLHICGWLWVSLEPLWCYFGRSEQRFLLSLQNTHIFQMNLNDFKPLEGRASGRFLGHSGLTLRPLLGNFAQLGASLSIWSLLRNHLVRVQKTHNLVAIFCNFMQL